MKRRALILISFLQIFLFYPICSWSTNTNDLTKIIQDKKNEIITCVQGKNGKINLESYDVNISDRIVTLNFSGVYSYQPFRSEIITNQKNRIRKVLGDLFIDYEIRLNSSGRSAEALIPNFYRGTSIPIDSSRLEKRKDLRIPNVQNTSNPIVPTKGLFNRNIAVWPSHGWYYEQKDSRWDWQRSRLFGTVEDAYTPTIILPYLVPMLEKAGAQVFLPRERDTQTHEVIVDADKSTGKSKIKMIKGKWGLTPYPGFAIGNPPYSNGENPFTLGHCHQFLSKENKKVAYEWIPDIPENGEYAVYISYQSLTQSTTSARYQVYHSGGVTEFKVNQRIGGRTWIYLGTFQFEKEGKNKVVLAGQTDKPGELITADAVRFGGGMGNIARCINRSSIDNQNKQKTVQGSKICDQSIDSIKSIPTVSGRPRYVEGARYYLQYAGVPDTIVYTLTKGGDDYKDDYLCRGFWVNYLNRKPNLETEAGQFKGLGIPIDLSFALHTDAGITPNDSIIGTLAIFSTEADSGLFPNMQSRWASRDLTDMIQSQLVDDIRAQFNPKWTRRGLWNKPYSEAYGPQVPATLLELLSHENLADMKFGHDPHFKFAVARSIYKAMAKFIAFQNGTPCVIQPLPVSHFRITPGSNNTVSLSWRAVNDPLEPSAKAEKYKIYQRIGDKGFDNGIIVNDTTYTVKDLKPGEIYSFKIAAINEGGESFPSEILATSIANTNDKPVLIVNGFNRVSAPSAVDTSVYSGFTFNLDPGVSDHSDIGFVGDMYDFNRNSTFKDNDCPGWGASYGDFETKIIPGNTFDFSVIHGKAISNLGHSFVSTSDEAFKDGLIDVSAFNTIDLLLGKEKTTTYPDGSSRFSIFVPSLRSKLSEFTSNGGNLLISGAYVGSDLQLMHDTLSLAFAEKVLHYKPQTDHAAKIGQVEMTGFLFGKKNQAIDFNTSYNPQMYTVDSADAILPVGEGAFTIYRYSENTKSAAVAYSGAYKTIVTGFPLETITDPDQLEGFFKDVFHFFNNKTKSFKSK
ncbi:MAG: fibronectin type III domain-containing protein [Bacteroidota bacterium]|nr:fibronectin type III domain-containing protein [Bacteroidota bacterium]